MVAFCGVTSLITTVIKDVRHLSLEATTLYVTNGVAHVVV